MRPARLLPVILALSLSLGLFHVSGISTYVPHAGDHFAYHETVDVANGVGYYAGYSDHTDTTGSETMNQVFSNGTVASGYGFTWTFRDNQGSTKNGGSSGNFTWSSSVPFYYVHGNDSQIGYTGPLLVWFYIDNSIQKGDTFSLLDTPMTVQSSHYGFFVPSENRYIDTIFAKGSSSYTRNDVYTQGAANGPYSATYAWSAYFDPTTGYIVGYVWEETDRNSSGDSFTYTENLSVTSTTYPLTAGTAPPSPLVSILIGLGIVLAIIIVFVIIVVVLVRRSRRMKLPKHAYQQEYRPPVPSPMPPPSIDLTPKQPPVQQIVIKEVVKVNCKYCGALIDSTVQTCPICGAPRT
jgi:hypothetical protein